MSGTTTSPSSPAAPAAAASDDKPTNKTIEEGSAKMCFPADQETTVFYNPVQVQNRDLSVLMITLAAERRALRLAVKAKRQELRSQGVHPGATLNQTIRDYEQTLKGSECVQQQDTKRTGLEILDALAASGLRSIRYWKEIPGVKHVTINDLDTAAVERAKYNLRLNGLEDQVIGTGRGEDDDQRPHGIRVEQGDAMHLLYTSRRPHDSKKKNTVVRRHEQQLQWDVIDLDPYGSAAPFLDGAVQAVADGGLLCVTCTDMIALGGSRPETCFGRYASMPIPSAGYLQELALRILLQSLAVSAARYGRTIKPLLSVGMDFYVRVFCEVQNSKAAVNELSLKLGYVYQSTQCSSFHVAESGQKKKNVYQPGRTSLDKCQETGSVLKVGGPFWLGPLHDADTVKEALRRLETSHTSNDVLPNMNRIATRDRLTGLLTSCQEELPDIPLYYKLPDLAKCLVISTPPMIKVQAALINAGFRVSGFHKEPQAVKTDAPSSTVWDVMRAWCKQQNLPVKKPKEGSTAEKILAVEPSIEVDFSVPSQLRHRDIASKKVARFPMNPEPNWGPKPKASGNKKRKLEKESDGVEDNNHKTEPMES